MLDAAAEFDEAAALDAAAEPDEAATLDDPDCAEEAEADAELEAPPELQPANTPESNATHAVTAITLTMFLAFTSSSYR